MTSTLAPRSVVSDPAIHLVENSARAARQQHVGEIGAQRRRARGIAAHISAQNMRSVRFADQRAQFQPIAIEHCMRGDWYLAATFKAGIERAFGGDAGGSG